MSWPSTTTVLYRVFRSVAFALLLASGVVMAGEVPVSEALKTAMRHTPGKVVAHEKAQDGSVPVYRIKILSDGGVMKTLMVNRATGKIVK